MTKKLRIGYFADGPWSHQSFMKIINDGRFQILFIVPRNDTKDDTNDEDDDETDDSLFEGESGADFVTFVITDVT